MLVNNAGLVGPAGAPAHELEEDEWTTMVDVDLNGPWRCAKAVLPDMLARRSGAIVNVASTAGMVAFPFFANYVAAKHGVIGLTRALALDYAPHSIRVNAICPTSVRDEPELDSAMLGGVASMLGVDAEDYEALSLPHHPLGSLVSGADVAAAIVWLCSEGAGRSDGRGDPRRRWLHRALSRHGRASVDRAARPVRRLGGALVRYLREPRRKLRIPPAGAPCPFASASVAPSEASVTPSSRVSGPLTSVRSSASKSFASRAIVGASKRATS